MPLEKSGPSAQITILFEKRGLECGLDELFLVDTLGQQNSEVFDSVT